MSACLLEAAPSAWAAATQRLRTRLPRTLAFMVMLCGAIGLLLASISGGRLAAHMIYSFTVGFSCLLVVDGVRLLTALGSDAYHRLRGLAPSAAGDPRGWRGVIVGVLFAVPLGPMLGLTLGDWITGYRSASLLDFGAANTRMTFALALLGSLVSVVVLSTLERLSAARAQAEAAERTAAENQLRLLQSQLEPHMLFNTLANLRVLIAHDPARAQAMLDRLIAFLRATLNASRAPRQPLEAEFAQLADYLALIAVRMGPRLATAFELPAELSGVEVPPLLLQPLVENAVKHGLEPKVEGGRIEVTARRAGERLELTVRDSGVGLGAAPADGSRFGLQQVRERLAALYGGRASLELAPAAGGGAVATITLPG